MAGDAHKERISVRFEVIGTYRPLILIKRAARVPSRGTSGRTICIETPIPRWLYVRGGIDGINPAVLDRRSQSKSPSLTPPLLPLNFLASPPRLAVSDRARLSGVGRAHFRWRAFAITEVCGMGACGRRCGPPPPSGGWRLIDTVIDNIIDHCAPRLRRARTPTDTIGERARRDETGGSWRV